MAIYKIEYSLGSTTEWGYWIEDENSAANPDPSTHWLVCLPRDDGCPIVSAWNKDLSKYAETFEQEIHNITKLEGVTLGSLFQQLHDITEGD